MSVVYNPLSGNFETKEPGPQGPAGTVSAAGDGSQATPSISFASDTNTGLYRYAADSIGVSTGGSNRIVVNSSGNVGVGTTNPTERLQVTDGTYSNFYIAPGYNSGAGTRMGVGGGEFLAFGAAPFSTERMRITSAGNVGIGTSNPQHLLDCASIGRFTGNTNSATSGAGIEIGYDSSSTTGFIQSYNRGSSAYLSTAVDGADIRLKIAAVEKVRISSAGNVGIGTTSPNYALDVALGIGITEGQALQWHNGSGSNSAQIYGDASDNLVFRNTSSNTERIRIDGSGRLLCGTSSAPTSTAVFAGRSDSGNAPVVRLDTKNAAPANGEQLGNLYFGSTSDTSFNSGARITARRDGGTWTANTSLPTRLEFSTTANGAATSTERVRIDKAGNVFLRQAGGSERVYFTGSGSASIGPASYATSSTTLYIGNAAIQVSSDERIKENIQDTQLDALAAVNQIKVKDFTWNDPSDTSHNNRNARGKWTGLIAQELVEILPFVVNAPRNENGEIDHDSENIWTLDQSQLCPVLIKAIQQQQEIIAALETRIVALEAN